MASKNAIVQAVKRLRPKITRNALFALFELPHTFTTHNRYWSETYNIQPWADRSDVEQHGALTAAIKLLNK